MRIYYYLVIITGLMALFAIAGIPTPTSYVLNTLNILNIENITNTSFYTAIVAIFIAVGAGGVLIGYFTKTSPESYLLGSFMAAIMVLFIGDMISIVSVLKGYGQTWMYYVAWLIMSPLIVGYIISLIDYWRGTD